MTIITLTVFISLFYFYLLLFIIVIIIFITLLLLLLLHGCLQHPCIIIIIIIIIIITIHSLTSRLWYILLLLLPGGEITIPLCFQVTLSIDIVVIRVVLATKWECGIICALLLEWMHCSIHHNLFHSMTTPEQQWP